MYRLQEEPSATTAAAIAVFMLFLCPLPHSGAQECGGSIFKAPTTISSPKFPNKYPKNTNCQWVVRAPIGKSVQINVTRFALGDLFDSLRIFDGVSVTCQTPLTTYTGFDAAAGRSLLLGQNVTVAFSSDGIAKDNGTRAGFQLSVAFVDASSLGGGETASTTSAAITSSRNDCGGSLRGSGRLTSPNYSGQYPPNAHCVWQLFPNDGMPITIRIVNLKLESPWDTLRVYRSAAPGPNDVPAAEYTGTSESMIRSFEGSSTVTVVFTSDESIELAGFEAIFYSNASSPEPNVVPHANFPRPGVCGIHDVRGASNNRIVGGTTAKPQAWPWQVHLSFMGVINCGGSLITSQWIVTAAHCIFTPVPQLYTITLGMHKQFSNDSKKMQVKAAKIIVHPSYVNSIIGSDIALIKLKEPVKLTNAIRPICLPLTDATPGTNCYVTGWGETEETGSNVVLRQASIPILDRNCCNRFLPNFFNKNMTCAGNLSGGKDTCQGDSGGPLACKVDGVFWLYGIASWGVGCADPYWPGIYTRVPGYVGWIRQTIVNN